MSFMLLVQRFNGLASDFGSNVAPPYLPSSRDRLTVL